MNKNKKEERGDGRSVGKCYVEVAKWVQSLGKEEISLLKSPIDLDINVAIPLELDPLVWHNFKCKSKKMKITNSGHTLILSAKWKDSRPYLTGGSLLGKYVFSQLHFHWGRNNMEGSEHTVDGIPLSLEMHLVHFNTIYLTQNAALSQSDGIVVVGYLFKLQALHNRSMNFLLKSVPLVRKAHTSTQLQDLSLSDLIKQFGSDYYLYWGSNTSTGSTKSILWMICREPIGISAEQMSSFRTLLNENSRPVTKNFRPISSLESRPLFHISPSEFTESTLLPMARVKYI